jgi:hypothetical protein
VTGGWGEGEGGGHLSPYYHARTVALERNKDAGVVGDSEGTVTVAG